MTSQVAQVLHVRKCSEIHLHAPNDDSNVIALPARPSRIRRRAALGRLINEYRQVA